MSAKGLSDEEIKDRIVANFSTLVADLDPDQMSDYLIEGLVITVVQWQEILHKRLTKQGRCRELLNLLLTTKNPKSTSVFMNALERNIQWQWILDLLSQKQLPKEIENDEPDGVSSESDRRLEEARLKWAEEKEELLERQRQLQKQVEELQQRVEELKELCEDDANLNDLDKDTAKNLERSISRMSIRSRKSLGRSYVSGRIHLKLIHTPSLHQLQVTVVACKGLGLRRVDSYVKLYVLPDKAKISKRKTAVKYNTSNPDYMETFTYPLSIDDWVTYTLRISVWRKFNLMPNKCIGEVVFALDEDLEDEIDDWYYLEKELP